jgi:hypothetical protein
MKARFRLVRRGSKFYSFDTVSRKRTSLKTAGEHEAQRLINIKNEAHVQPALNLQIARANLAATDPEVRSRTWQQVMDIMGGSKKGPTLARWHTA